MQVFKRADHFKNPPNMTLEEIMNPPAIQAKPNSYLGRSKADLEAHMLKKPMWRYHHELSFLKAPAEEKTLHATYAKRVQTMFDMVEAGLLSAGVPSDLEGRTVCDLACAEGFVADHFIGKGVTAIDCYELNLDQIERFHLVQSYKDRSAASVYRLDLESPSWSRTIGRQYDVVLCLGIVYHFENPMLFLRNVFGLTGQVCVVESDTPIEYGDASLLVPIQQQVTKKPGEVRYLLEMRPTRQALVEMLMAVGFSEVRVIAAPESGTCRYLKSGSKSVLVAIK